MRCECPIALAARIDDGNLPLEAVPRQRPVRAVEPPPGPAHLWTAPSEPGCNDNIHDSFLGRLRDSALQQ